MASPVFFDGPVSLITTPPAVKPALAQLTGSPVLGLSFHWPVLALASPDAVVLVHVGVLGHVPAPIAAVLESESIVKASVGVTASDKDALDDAYGVRLVSVVDVVSSANAAGYFPPPHLAAPAPYASAAVLSNLANQVLGTVLDTALAGSDYSSRSLSAQQISYAATCGWLSVALHNALAWGDVVATPLLHCAACGLRASSRSQLALHEGDTGHITEPWESGALTPAKKAGRKSVLATPVTRYILCDVCDSFFDGPVALQAHQDAKRHYLPCPCGATFYTRAERDVHQVDAGHMIDCPICGEAFATKAGAHAHQEVERHVFCCSYCSDDYYTQRDIDVHTTQAHESQCEFCSHVIFDTNPALALAQHYDRFHTGAALSSQPSTRDATPSPSRRLLSFSRDPPSVSTPPPASPSSSRLSRARAQRERAPLTPSSRLSRSPSPPPPHLSSSLNIRP